MSFGSRVGATHGLQGHGHQGVLKVRAPSAPCIRRSTESHCQQYTVCAALLYVAMCRSVFLKRGVLRSVHTIGAGPKWMKACRCKCKPAETFKHAQWGSHYALPRAPVLTVTTDKHALTPAGISRMCIPRARRPLWPRDWLLDPGSHTCCHSWCMQAIDGAGLLSGPAPRGSAVSPVPIGQQGTGVSRVSRP